MLGGLNRGGQQISSLHSVLGALDIGIGSRSQRHPVPKGQKDEVSHVALVNRTKRREIA